MVFEGERGRKGFEFSKDALLPFAVRGADLFVQEDVLRERLDYRALERQQFGLVLGLWREGGRAGRRR